MTPAFWRVHYLIPAFIALASLGMALGIAHFTTMRPHRALAQAGDNVRGWAWATNVGWFSMNDQLPHCTPSGPGCSSGGSYGVNMASTLSAQPHSKQGYDITGYAWSDKLGFVCFGSSCNIVQCGALAPSDPGYFYAYAEPVAGTNTVEVHGWASICGLKEAGWISLNCADPVAGSCSGLPTDKKFRLVYNPSDYKYYSTTFNGNPALTEGVSFGYNGNADDTGIGYISFYPAATDGMYLHVDPEDNPLCADGIDNDLNGKTDCADAPCNTRPVCTTSELNWFGGSLAQQYTACHNNVDDNSNGVKDCTGDPSCSTADVCKLETAFTNGCTDGIDNNADGTADCTGVGPLPAAPECAADPACAPPPPPQSQCIDNAACAGILDAKLHANCCCTDLTTNGTNPLDCLDTDCQKNAPVCTAWTQVSAGNVYAGGGITGTKAPSQAGKTNAAYCLRANNTIEWTSQFAQCTEAAAGAITLPSTATGYRGTLGSLDLSGIRNGRYGTVQTLPTNVSPVPNTLSGKIYHYVNVGGAVGDYFTLPGTVFDNGTGANDSGAGLLFIEGADLHITGPIGYTVAQVQTRLKNLASFGVIVIKDAVGNGGNILIDSAATKVSGAYFAEGIIHTGTAGVGSTDAYLRMYGIFVAKQFDLQRNNNTDPTQPAEQFIFDGRAVVNPPPGLQDVSKSLPRPSDATF